MNLDNVKRGRGMETKKCNKCGKVKPLNEMTRRRNEEKVGEAQKIYKQFGMKWSYL